MLLASDRLCEAHKSSFVRNQSATNTVLGIATSLLAGMATFVGSGSTPVALAAAAGMTNASRSVINEEIYYQFVTVSISKAIADMQRPVRAEIEAGLRKDIREYSIDFALLDITRYHSKCSFYAGLQRLNDAMSRPSITIEVIDERIGKLDGEIKAINALIADLSAADQTLMQTDLKVLLQRRIALNVQRAAISLR